MNRRTQNTVGAFVLLAIAALCALAAISPGVNSAEVTAAVTFGAFALVVYALPYALAGGNIATSAFLAHLSCVLLAPSWTTAGLVALGSALGELVSRRAPIKAAFNVAQYTLSVSLAIFAYRATGGSGLMAGAQPSLLPVVACWLAFSLTNSSAVAAVVSASTSRRMIDVWRENSLTGFVFEVISLPFVVAFAVAYVRFGVVPTIAMLALLLVMRQLSSANEALHSSNRELLELTVTTLEARDPYTSGHSRRVAQYSRMVGQALNLSQKQLDRLAVAALLHDVGKIHEVFAPILSKPGRLTPEERAVMETHPIKGAELVKISSQLRDAVEPIRHHHESWDGSGYPDGIKGDAIPLFARIIAVADTIDAMASDRPYRRGMGAETIREELIRMRGIQFDPSLIDQLVRTRTLTSILRIATVNGSASTAHEQKLSLVSVR